MKKILTAYFSATNVTANVAKKLSEITNSDIFEIKPTVLYSKADLNWMDKNSRSSVEMNDLSFRPEISTKLSDIELYDTIFLCFPIWWYVAPTIINSFLESYDFSNKTIVLFATSGSSGFGKTLAGLKNSVDKSAKIIEGKMLNGNFSKNDIEAILSLID